jgi:PAS domain S-box-containing protein
MLARELFELLDHTADAGVALTQAGEVCAWNASAAALFGYTRDEAIGRSCFDLFQGRGLLRSTVCSEHCPVRECAAKGSAIPDFDLEVKTRSGRAWVNVSTIVHADRRTGRQLIVHLMRDITGRKRTEALAERIKRLSAEIAGVPAVRQRTPPTLPLSSQELRVLQAFSEGMTAVDIARELHISSQTLRNHLHHINQKLGTHTRLEAVIHAIRRRLI